MFTGATALLSRTYAPAERMRAQATDDVIVFGTVAGTAFSSGAIHAMAGRAVLDGLMVVPITVAVVLVLRQGLVRRAPAPISVG